MEPGAGVGPVGAPGAKPVDMACEADAMTALGYHTAHLLISNTYLLCLRTAGVARMIPLRAARGRITECNNS